VDIQIISYLIGFGGLISALSAWIPMVRYFREASKDAEKRAVEHGKHLAEVAKIAKDVDMAHLNIRDIYARLEKNQNDIRDMQHDIKHIVKAVDSLCSKRGGCSEDHN
jgi:hypothetical protein